MKIRDDGCYILSELNFICSENYCEIIFNYKVGK